MFFNDDTVRPIAAAAADSVEMAGVPCPHKARTLSFSASVKRRPARVNDTGLSLDLGHDADRRRCRGEDGRGVQHPHRPALRLSAHPELRSTMVCGGHVATWSTGTNVLARARIVQGAARPPIGVRLRAAAASSAAIWCVNCGI